MYVDNGYSSTTRFVERPILKICFYIVGGVPTQYRGLDRIQYNIVGVNHVREMRRTRAIALFTAYRYSLAGTHL